MIQTFIRSNPVELDTEVNNFMRQRRQNLPVRTECYLINGMVIHKATVFYDQDFRLGGSTIAAEQTQPQAAKPVSDKKGALWIQNNGTLTGNYNGKNVQLEGDQANTIRMMREGQKINLVLDGDKAVVIPNKFKKTEKHPDYVIFGRTE